MGDNNYLSLDFSILYRCTQKYYDIALQDLDINAGQVPFLTIINENEGLSMNQLAKLGSFDKGTVTKGIKILSDKGYIETITNEDKRIKYLYLTNKAKAIMSKIYAVKQSWWEFITKDIDSNLVKDYVVTRNQIVLNARSYLDLNLDDDKVKFFGLQKLTLLDFPGNLASTVFCGGCNFRCPFCQNSDLVFLPEGIKEITREDILNYLKSRHNLLDGICISGGEPLLNKGLKEFIIQIKELGLKVKLDTNGSFYEKLKELGDAGLLDYVAVDIKNSKEKYGETIGIPGYDTKEIEKTISYLKQGNIPYEFRTTVVEEFHDEKDFEKIGKWLKGARNYYLQRFEDSECVIRKGLHSPSLEKLNKYKDIAKKYIENVEIRGI